MSNRNRYRLLTEATHRAQKDYWCVHCSELIKKGARYVFTAGSIEGKMQTDRWHRECREAVNTMSLEELDFWDPGIYKRGTLRDKWARERAGE